MEIVPISLPELFKISSTYKNQRKNDILAPKKSCADVRDCLPYIVVTKFEIKRITWCLLDLKYNTWVMPKYPPDGNNSLVEVSLNCRKCCVESGTVLTHFHFEFYQRSTDPKRLVRVSKIKSIFAWNLNPTHKQKETPPAGEHVTRTYAVSRHQRRTRPSIHR